MVKKILFLLLLTGVSGAYAQILFVSDTLLFSGMVFHNGTGEPLPDVYCRWGKGEGVVSGRDGAFRIRLHRGDTVRFTHVGFRPCRVVIPDSLRENEYMLGVFLSPDTVELSEVLIVRRWRDARGQDFLQARRNMRGIMQRAYDPTRPMDADMNQRMMIEEYAREVEMKGHVDVGFGVGTHSLDALRLLRLQKKQKENREYLLPMEVDLLKRIYYSEKSGKIVE